MLKILQARLQQHVDQELSEVQAGFQRGRGTRDRIANIGWIIEKAREFQKNIYFCFIDYAKAFDRVDHSKLWQVLKEMGVPDHLICLLRNLYVGQEATVRTGHGTTDWFKIEKGVSQGCILSPGLFNLYAEHIMRKAGLDESPVGIKIAGRNINNLSYADDTTLTAESEEKLNSLLMWVKEESAKVGLKLSIKKTKMMASSPLTSWQIDGEEMEVVTDFIFLGSKITADGDCTQEIKRRLLLGRKAMANLDSILKSRDITLPTKVHPEDETQILWPPNEKEGLPGEESNAGNNRWQKKKGTAENEGPCIGNQQSLAHSRLWDAVVGFLHVFANMQMKLSQDSSQIDLLKELLDLLKDMVVYFCGQESLRRNEVAFIVNKRVGKAALGYSLQNDRMISVRIQGKPFNITVVQVYAPTTGAEEAEVDQFYEGLQHLLELTPKDDVLIIMGNAQVGSQKITRVTGKFGLGVQNEAGHRLVEFCQENTMVITNTLFQQPKRRLDTWTSPDSQHRNQIDYVLCSQIWRSSIQSVKTRPGADCGSDYELLVSKFRHKWKKVGKSTRPLRVPEELWTEVHNIVQEVATKTIPKKKKCKKAKWLSEEAFQIAEERREAKDKGERERYTQMNAEFQRIARRDKNAFLNEQCKEIEENNRIGRTRDLFKKIGDMKGTDLTEAEEIKKRWQDYTEELYKKELNVSDNHDGVVTDLEPDILECEVKRALGSLSNNKASGGDSIPAELFKILKDDAVKVLHSICQQIWKTQQRPQDWKISVYIPIPKKGNAKECSNYRTIALISHASKVMLKILQARLQQYVDRELSEVQAGFQRGRGTRDQIANIHCIMGKAREFQKNIYFCFIDYAKDFVWITTNCGKFLKRWEYQTI
ncbi:Craniofacial development protein 2 [Varanus komodoensis]|nr:Craniofacial development protein 2 [Varanus komodoensis]